MSGPFKMKGHSLPGPNQRVSPVKQPDYKAQGDVIDKRDEAITNFDKASDDMKKYTLTDSQKSQIEERKNILANQKTSSTDSIANVNKEYRVKQTSKAFNKLMGNTPKSGKKAGKPALGAVKGMPYASPAKNFKGEVHDHPHPTPKKKMSQEMKDKIAEAKAKSIKKANIELTKQGKAPVSSTSLD